MVGGKSNILTLHLSPYEGRPTGDGTYYNTYISGFVDGAVKTWVTVDLKMFTERISLMCNERKSCIYILNIQQCTGTYVCGPCDLLATRDLKSLYTARGETTLARTRGVRTDSIYIYIYMLRGPAACVWEQVTVNRIEQTLMVFTKNQNGVMCVYIGYCKWLFFGWYNVEYNNSSRYVYVI